MLENLSVCLVEPKYSENIGMVARACVNMGCLSLAVVNPQNYNIEKAIPTATPKGVGVLNSLRIFSDLSCFLNDYHKSWAITARCGGWRRNVQTPQNAAGQIISELESGMKVALVFGNEKQGLSNEDIKLCSEIISIPQYGILHSLNLAQAALIILYECAKRKRQIDSEYHKKSSCAKDRYNGIGEKELFLLEDKLKEVLALLDCNQGRNSDYYFLQWHSLLARANLRRHEFAAFMGLCRQIKNHVSNDSGNTSNGSGK